MTAPTASHQTAPRGTPAALQARAFARVLLFLTLVIVVLGGAFLYLEHRKARQAEQKATSARQHVLLRPKDESTDWRVKEGARVEELNRSLESLRRELKELRDEKEREERHAKRGGTTPRRGRTRADGTTVPPVPPLDEILPPPDGGTRPGPTPRKPPTMPAKPAPDPARTSPTGPPAAPGTVKSGTVQDAAPAPAAPGHLSGPVSRVAPEPRAAPTTALPTETGKLRVITPRAIPGQRAGVHPERVGWLPSGSIIPARLLTGVDASTTSGTAAPYPVLLRLTDSAILPNDFRMQIQHCVVVGAAVADLASERVAIRTETLSCLLRSGGFITIDEALKGHVVGNDGRLGLRARIVQKEGQLIARSLVAGFLSGLSDAFKPRISYAPIQLGGGDVTENRSFTLPPMQDTLAAAGLSGVGKSMDLLAKHYVTLAEKVAPVAEVPSGVPVDIVILQGIPLKWRSAKTADPHPALID